MQAIAHGQLGLLTYSGHSLEDVSVRDLFDSMYRGYPIGYLLFWDWGASGTRRSHGPKAARTTRVIVDGQQRLTSLYAVMHASQYTR